MGKLSFKQLDDLDAVQEADDLAQLRQRRTPRVRRDAEKFEQDRQMRLSRRDWERKRDKARRNARAIREAVR